ncbi:unnamed protein product [Dibothriocephalus latus]|uniref:Uncharacterized protein n=1 Tax=Dibothriocephalus latus TaxID=60516 RepID=A0A3P7QZL8_DIBLA|nr:unnamed protein product [Dibothriocephalus latus]
MASPDLLHFGGSFEKRNAFRGELLSLQTPVQGGIKTNGSLIRSHSGPNIVSEQKSAGSPRRAVNFTPRSVTNPDHLASRADSHSSGSLAQDAQEEDYDSEEDNHCLALYSKSVPSNFDQVSKATGDTCVVEEYDADESPNKMLLSECPEFIPYLNPPSPSRRPGHHNLLGVNGDSIEGEEVNTDDEIVYGFRSVDSKLHENGNEKSTQDADKSDLLWELLEAQMEAEAEAEDRLIHSLRKSNKSELSKSKSDSLRKPLIPPKVWLQF